MQSVRRAAVVTHGKAATIGPALERVQALAARAGVELQIDEGEAEKHGMEAADGAQPDVAIVLGGDGTMLRALGRFLGTGVPVIGVNFGRVGFLTSIPPDELEAGVARVLAGDYAIVELPTLDLQVGGKRVPAVNDVVITSATLGRMIELGYAVGGEDLGRQPCDGLICATPSGSTAYNLSNGGPVLVWGLDAMVVTFVAPHSILVRPLVVGGGGDLAVHNLTSDVDAIVLVDGHAVGKLEPGEGASARLGAQRSLLGTLPETTFFRRYRSTFAHR